MLRLGLYNVAGAAARTACGLLVLPVLIHYLGVADYGLWALVMAAVGLVALAEGGLATAVTVFLSEDLAGDDAERLSATASIAVTGIVLLASLAALFLWYAALPLARLLPSLTDPQRDTVAFALRVAGAVVWTRVVQQVLVGILQAYHRYGHLNLLATLQAIVTNLGLAVVVWRGGGVYDLIVWQAAAGGASLLAHGVLAGALLRGSGATLAMNRARAGDFWRYGFQVWLTNVGGTLFLQGDRVIVGALLGARSLGIYAAITTIAAQINALSAVPVQPLMPVLGKLWVDRTANLARIRERIAQALRLNALGALGLGGALFGLGPLLMPYLLPDTADAASLTELRMVVTIYALFSLNAVGYYVLFAARAVRVSMIVQGVSAAAALILVALGAMAYGLPGAVAGNAGYLGIAVLTIRAMRYAGIPAEDWLGWLRFPLLWFAAIIPLNLLVARSPALSVLLVIVQSCVLVGWFLVQERLPVPRLGVRRAAP